MTLKELYNSKGANYYPTDKNTSHTYFDLYEALFCRYKNDKINIFEVGVLDGGSIRLWEDYFPNANVFACDNVQSVNCVPFVRAKVFIRSIQGVDFFVFDKYPLSIAIDDGSHILADQLFFIKSVYPKLKKGGLLIVEDVLDIELRKSKFAELGLPFSVIDMRHTGRRDNVLLLFIKP